jgi:hypothetical protein
MEGMKVHQDLKNLVKLQEIDQEIHEIEKNKERLPRLLHLAADGLRAAESEMDTAKGVLEVVSKERRTSEGELSDEGEHLNRLKLRTSEIKDNKAYFAHMKEIDDCQKKISKLEEVVVELIDKVEKAEAELKAKEEALAQEHSKYEDSKVNIEKRFEAGDQKLVEMRLKRDELVPGIGKEALELYNDVRRRYPDSAVVEAKDGNCTGCRMVLPPQYFANVRKGEMVVSCVNCRRIMYFAAPVEGQ